MFENVLSPQIQATYRILRDPPGLVVEMSNGDTYVIEEPPLDALDEVWDPMQVDLSEVVALPTPEELQFYEFLERVLHNATLVVSTIFFVMVMSGIDASSVGMGLVVLVLWFVRLHYWRIFGIVTGTDRIEYYDELISDAFFD